MKKTETLSEWLARGNQIKKVQVDTTWKTQDLPALMKNAEKYQSKGGRVAKSLRFVYRAKDETTIHKFLNGETV